MIRNIFTFNRNNRIFIKEKFKLFIKRVFNILGLEIVKYDVHQNLHLALASIAAERKIDLIFDIGANLGQFRSQIRSQGFKGKIISFEPLTGAHKILKKISKSDDLWTIHPRTAIGSFVGQIDINISKNLYSSSILQITEKHLSADKNAVYFKTEKSNITTLNDIYSNLKNESNFLIKIDTQGYEWEVIEGASEVLSTDFCKGIICELSLDELYKGQKLWIEIVAFLEQKNFKLWTIFPAFSDRKNNKLLQLDALFLKN